MKRASVPLGRWLRATSMAAGPLALSFIVLGALGWLPADVAAITWALLTALVAILIRVHLADLVGLENYAEALARGEEKPAAARMRSRMGRELLAHFQRVVRQYAARLGRSETLFSDLERVLDSLPGPLLLLDGERRVIRANRTARELLGAELLTGDLAATIRNPRLLDAIDRAVQDSANAEVEFTLPAPVERTFAARIERLPEPSADGATVLVALVDITATRRTEQMRADFVANASHEIRTPLATLIGFIETLQGAARDDKDAQARFLKIMEQHAQRMARLVDDLLSLSRIEMNEHTPPTDRVDLAAVLKSVQSNSAWRARERSVELAIAVEPDLGPIVGDTDELVQVFQNLVDNAIKYGRADGMVTMTARHVSEAPGSIGWKVSEQGAVAVSVRDEGEGIPREHLPRLTERFYRVDTARSRELGGTGLGLAIVKHIVSRHRGALVVDSELGKGSTFTVYLRPAAAIGPAKS